MRRNTEDKTLERNYQQKWKHLIEEYLLTKKKKHPSFKFAQDFYKFHKINRQTFCKYYNRYRNSNSLADLLPCKRGPKWKSRRPDSDIETAVVAERKKGLNKYEICQLLREKFQGRTPSPSGVYNIIKRENLNRLKPKMKEEKKKIIKERFGQLGHIDCHYLSRDMILNDTKRYYLVCIIDDCSRIAWAEVVPNVKSLEVMFAILRCLNVIHQDYKIKFEEVLTDNGSEFASKANLKEHPFERMLFELGIKHRYTRPYRPQTNGKVERFWRTLNDDLIEGTTFDTLEHFKTELEQYLLYYNQHRPHQSLDGLTPAKFAANLSTN